MSDEPAGPRGQTLEDRKCPHPSMDGLGIDDLWICTMCVRIVEAKPAIGGRNATRELTSLEIRDLFHRLREKAGWPQTTT